MGSFLKLPLLLIVYCNYTYCIGVYDIVYLLTALVTYVRYKITSKLYHSSIPQGTLYILSRCRAMEEMYKLLLLDLGGWD